MSDDYDKSSIPLSPENSIPKLAVLIQQLVADKLCQASPILSVQLNPEPLSMNESLTVSCHPRGSSVGRTS